MELTHKQKEIARDRHRFRVVNAGRRFGKTILAAEEMIGVAVAGNDNRVAYIAPTFQQARDIAWEHLKQRCFPIIVDSNESQLKLTVRTQHGGTSIIQLKSWDSVESLRGQKFHFLVVDEVAMMRNFWIGWQEVLRPALTDTKGGALFISTPKGFNHFYDLYNFEAEESSFKSFHATTYDNPHIDPNEIEEAKRQLPEDQFAQEYLADFRKQEGLVYKEFDRSRHVIDDTEFDRLTLAGIVGKRAGIDWGWNNPSSSHPILKTRDGVYIIYDELYQAMLDTDDICDQVKVFNLDCVYPDPAEPDRCEIARKKGLLVRAVSKDVAAGIMTCQRLWRQNRLFVHQRCKNFIAEIEMYRYKERRADQNLPEEPVKEDDHAMDDTRYCLHMWENTDELANKPQQYRPQWKGTNKIRTAPAMSTNRYG